MIPESKIKELVKKKLTKYLELYKYRKTPERYALLDLLYDKRKLFRIEDLQGAMKEKHICISQATIYNTIRLFLKFNLIVKHQLGQNSPLYEGTYDDNFHYYMICSVCHEIKEMKDTSLKFFMQNKKFKQFYPVHYCFYAYGLCRNCFRKSRIQQLRNKKQ